MKTRRSPQSRGFTLIELAAVLAVVGVLVAGLVVSLRQHRTGGWAAGSLSNLRELGAGFASYAISNQERVATFSWRAGPTPSTFPDLQFAASDLDASANQLVDMVRRRGPRANFTLLPGTIVHPRHTLQVLMEFLDQPVLSPLLTAPSDDGLRCLQRLELGDPGGSAATCGFGGATSSILSRYASSYLFPSAFFSPDVRSRSRGNTVALATGFSNAYTVPAGAPLGRRLVSDIRFPSRKVQLAQRTDDSSNPRRFHLHSDASPPLLFADGSASVRATRHANRGIDPNSGGQAIIPYAPSTPLDPPLVSSGSDDRLNAAYFSTSMGLRGVDFGGGAVPWREDP